VVIDRYWNVLIANDSARRMMEGIPEHVMGPLINAFRISLHPDGIALAVELFYRADEPSELLLRQAPLPLPER
jgi:hypothetical protein